MVIVTLQRLILFSIFIGASLIRVILPTSFPALQKDEVAPPPQSQVSGQVTILVLDMSLSMSSNDVLGIRCSAAKSYIDLSRGDDQVGIIGLTNNDGQVDSQGFLTASIWQSPLSVKVDSNRKALKDAITYRPTGTPSCQYPSGTTPIYDALAKAFDLLKTATHTSHGQLSGSVIVLSDGQPDPDNDAQMDKVRNDLIPQFLKEGWPVETIALKAQEKYRTFLHDLAQQTRGLDYDDTQGNIPGTASPLNITSFFITILKRHQNRTANTYIPLQTLNGNGWMNDFIPQAYTKHLDVFIAKDEAVSATLTTPAGTVFPPAPPENGITISNDNAYYTIFSLDTPRPAAYQLDIEGTGQFLIYILETSSLQVSITSPTPTSSVLFLDHPFALAAQVVDTSNNQNELITGARFALSASIRYEGAGASGSGSTSRQVDLSDKDNPGTYQNILPLAPGSPAGLYSITVSVSGDTNASIGIAYREIRLVHAPVVHLFSSASEMTTAHTASIQQIQWPSLFQVIYNPNIAFTHWLGQPALHQHPLYPQIALDATIQVDASSLSHLRIVDAVVYSAMGSRSDLSISQDRGHFRFYLPRLPDGTYRLVLTLGGTFENGSLQPSPISYTFHLISMLPPQEWQQEALPVTLLYMLLLLLFLMSLFHAYLTGPLPFGEVQLRKDNVTYQYPFKKVRRNLFAVLFKRNTIYSERVPVAQPQDAANFLQQLPTGLMIRFYRGGKIKVRRRRGYKVATYWKYKEGQQEKELTFAWREVEELIYQSSNEAGTTSSVWNYLIDPEKPKKL